MKFHNKKGFSKIKILLAIILIIVIAVVWWLKTNIYVKHFSVVELNKKEEVALRKKLKRIREREKEINVPDGGVFKAEVYRENDGNRIIIFSEKELNALLAMDNKDLANKLNFRLSDDLISLKVIIKAPEELPLIGGRNILVRTGMSLLFKDGKISFALKGVSISGISLPNSWLGYIKNKDLLAEFNNEEGFWGNFQKGIENLVVKDGIFYVKLKK